MNSQAQLSAAQQLATQGAGATDLEGLTAGAEGEDDDDDDIPDLEAPDDEGPVDETGVDPKDIDLVMAQVNCSRAKAVKVLKESGGDLINASAYFPPRLSEFLLIWFMVQSWRRASDPGFLLLSCFYHLSHWSQCIVVFLWPFPSALEQK